MSTTETISNTTISTQELAANGNYQNTIATARSETWKLISSSKAAGASVAVMDNGSIVYSEGFGLADRENNYPVTNQTIFNIGSISKVFVAEAIMQLVDEQKVGLDHKVTEYIPEFKMADERYKDITVRMLLNHTSGLSGSHYVNMMRYKVNPTQLRDLLIDLQTAHLKHKPGTMAMYCNDGFTLAEIIVERVSGKSYADFLQERVFQPLAMNRAGRSVGERADQATAYYYDTTSGKRMPLEAMAVLGAGGLAMTPEDLCRFGDSFSAQGKHILSDALLAEMKKSQASPFSQQLSGDPFLPYGLGWDVVSIPDYQKQGIQVLGKGGDTNNYSSYIATAPDKRVTVAVIISTLAPESTSTALTILKALLIEKGQMTAETTTVTKPEGTQSIPQEWLAYEGLWIGGSGAGKLKFDQAKGTLTLYSIKGDSETAAMSLTYKNGYLDDGQGNQYRFVTVGGKDYLISNQQAVGISLQKADIQPSTAKLRIDIDGKTWLRRNVSPYDMTTTTKTYIVVSRLYKALPGYIDFQGVKQVQSPDFAGMVGNGNANGLRDQYELSLFDKDGTTWAKVTDMVFSPLSSAINAAQGATNVTIGQEGYNGWMQMAQDSVLSFQKPTAGRVIVYSPSHSVLYDSVSDSGEVYAPAQSLVVCAGDPGSSFTVNAR